MSSIKEHSKMIATIYRNNIFIIILHHFQQLDNKSINAFKCTEIFFFLSTERKKVISAQIPQRNKNSIYFMCRSYVADHFHFIRVLATVFDWTHCCFVSWLRTLHLVNYFFSKFVWSFQQLHNFVFNTKIPQKWQKKLCSFCAIIAY